MKNLLEASYLIKSPNVIVTPHTAFYTTEAEQAIMQTTVENIQSFLSGSAKNVVSPQ
ncbi:Phenyllactate dehydrogenase [compost metagenome]